MLSAFLVSAGAVVLAEMGDKTQLLAMAFATKYKAWKVMVGVFIATVFNHALAVLVGSLISQLDTVQIWIQAAASLSFIGFGLWTIRGDKLDGEDKKKTKFGPVVTVALAFFLAEMGDKTQLATVALATQFPGSPIGTLIGTTTGMLIADGIGIVIGVVLCKRLPDRVIKLVSAGVFAVFGFIGCVETMVKMNLSVGIIIAITAALAVVTGVSAYFLIRKNKTEAQESEPLVCVDRNQELE
jgi:putative Ca2+/H+ antiporter (TMEM165/GDT1 family)